MFLPTKFRCAPFPSCVNQLLRINLMEREDQQEAHPQPGCCRAPGGVRPRPGKQWCAHCRLELGVAGAPGACRGQDCRGPPRVPGLGELGGPRERSVIQGLSQTFHLQLLSNAERPPDRTRAQPGAQRLPLFYLWETSLHDALLLEKPERELPCQGCCHPRSPK